jgi:hypothetical protein
VEINGISNQGDATETRFRELTGATRTTRASLGDAVIAGHAVEIKAASSDTLNQVRAVKFIPLVAFHKTSCKWYVLSAPDIVALVHEKSRGQHTENPFESATLSIRQLERFHVAESELKNAVLEAITKGKRFGDLKKIMDDVLLDSKRLAEISRQRVSKLIFQNPVE